MSRATDAPAALATPARRRYRSGGAPGGRLPHRATQRAPPASAASRSVERVEGRAVDAETGEVDVGRRLGLLVDHLDAGAGAAGQAHEPVARSRARRRTSRTGWRSSAPRNPPTSAGTPSTASTAATLTPLPPGVSWSRATRLTSPARNPGTQMVWSSAGFAVTVTTGAAHGRTSARTSAAVAQARARSARRWVSALRHRAQSGLHRRDGRHAHRQLAHAEPGEHERALRLPGDAAAHAHPDAGRVGGVDGGLDHAQHGRVQRVGLLGQHGMQTIHRQHVLREVVRPDGEELHPAGELGGEHHRRWHLDHDADVDRLGADLGAARSRHGRWRPRGPRCGRSSGTSPTAGRACDAR